MDAYLYFSIWFEDAIAMKSSAMETVAFTFKRHHHHAVAQPPHHPESQGTATHSDLPVWEVAERMNFAGPSFFSKFFKGETGMTPGEYRIGK